jgi:hypothetical protein
MIQDDINVYITRKEDCFKETSLQQPTQRITTNRISNYTRKFAKQTINQQ